MSAPTTNEPRGAWVHLFAETGCGHGCRTIERHGAVVGRTIDSLTVQLYDWDQLDGRVPAPVPGAVLRLRSDELATLGAAVYESFTDARPAELEAVARGLGRCGHDEIPATRHGRSYEPTDAERKRDEALAALGVLSGRALSGLLLGHVETER